jgi:hypothetical protein
LAFRRRRAPPDAPAFSALMLWSLCLNALIVPLFGMLHMIMIGLLFIILLSDVAALYPDWEKPAWWGTMAVFGLGLALFAGSLLVWGLAGPHIALAELVYKITVPVGLALAAWLLMFRRPAAVPEKVLP